MSILLNPKGIQEKMPIREYLEKELGYSGRMVKKLLKEKRIRINGKAGYFDSYVRSGDKILIEEIHEEADEIVPEDIPLEILYEDEYMLAINKPPFMLMHPTPNNPKNTLANALSFYFKSRGLRIPVRFLSRLDMNTSGVVIVPKTAKAHSTLSAYAEEGGVKKLYRAVVDGVLEPEEGVIDLPIAVDEADKIKRCVAPGGAKAVTEYKTLDKYAGAVLLELKLITGRTHQIRVHMSYLNHPIIGDSLYGSQSVYIKRQALHAYTVELIHPETKENVTITAELPEDMKLLIANLKGCRN